MGNKKKRKQVAAFEVPQAKHPVASKTAEREGCPSWRFEDIDNGGPFPWSGLSGEKLHELMDGLKHYEKQPVAKTIGKGSKGTHHPCGVETLEPPAQSRLSEIRQDDHDQIWGFRALNHQEERVWAIRYGDVFHFLWWDPDHKVAPSAK